MKRGRPRRRGGRPDDPARRRAVDMLSFLRRKLAAAGTGMAAAFAPPSDANGNPAAAPPPAKAEAGAGAGLERPLVLRDTRLCRLLHELA
eukprot:CAMPEP_0118851930 /NCGR_PEP_ID=MMETSP1163-20130328/1170_1 /TAXON_ID=124430 /ORGANISM="Phaeomonas parva, Strain CCMP2877" /LENGTH=89 /DNA_ID=CAMNT_0006784327 /DNA_START=157 /DNA_END=422 /DNA_ORIENTATION=-